MRGQDQSRVRRALDRMHKRHKHRRVSKLARQARRDGETFQMPELLRQDPKLHAFLSSAAGFRDEGCP